MKRKIARLGHYPAPLRLGLFVIALLLLWLPLAAPIYWLGNNSNWVSILTLVLLYGEFILLIQFWGKHVYSEHHLLQRYGLKKHRRNLRELLIGLGAGTVTVLSLFKFEGWLGWLVWQQPVIYLPQVILEGLVIGLGLGFAEELLFRGWLLDELQRDYSRRMALWMNALLYAVLHYIKPLAEILRTLPGFLGLFLLGLTLVWAKRSRNRLALPIGLHAGLFWGYYIINVGQLVQYSGKVPDWITGVDRNPLAGIIGLIFLSVIAFSMGWRIQPQSQLNRHR